MNKPFLYTMYRQTCCNLLSLPKQRVRQWLNSFNSILSDADGVLWHFNDPIEGSADTLNTLRAMGKQIFIITNNSKINRQLMCDKANKFGIVISPSEVLTSGMAAATYLKAKNFDKTAYIVGRQGIVDEMKLVNVKTLYDDKDPIETEVGHYAKELCLDENVGAVVVGEDDFFTTAKLVKASTYLKDPKCMFLATSRDGSYPINNKIIPAAGPIVAAIKAATNRRPQTLGKPNPLMGDELIECGLIKPETTLMIGDTLHTDMAFGFNCGFQTLFIGTGVSTLEDVRKAQDSDSEKKKKMIPDVYLPRLSDLLSFLPVTNC